MKKQIIFTVILSLIAVLVLVFGCAIEQPAVDEEETVVAFTIGQEMMGAKTILPGEVVDITTYKILWWTEEQSETEPPTPPTEPIEGQYKTVKATTDTTTTVILLLFPGKYWFKVEGYNSTPFKVGEGYFNDDSEALYTVVPKKIQSIPITVRPLTGDGKLNVTVKWPDVDFDGITPEVSATITPVTGDTPIEASFTLNPNFPDPDARDATYQNEQIPAGYYRFFIQLVDPDPDPDVEGEEPEILWSTIEALRIIEDDTSSTTYELKEELNAIGLVEITEEMDNPLTIHFEIGIGSDLTSYWPDELPVDPFETTQGTNLTIIARPYDKDGNRVAVESFEWYKYGTVPLTASSKIDYPSYSTLNFGSGETIGYYWVNLLVTSRTSEDKIVLTSERIEVLVLESPPTP